MDIKTVYGFGMVAIGFLFQSIAKAYGIDGTIQITLDSLIAAGLFLVSGKEIYNRTKEKE